MKKILKFLQNKVLWLCLIVIALFLYVVYQQDYTQPKITWGISFSNIYAKELGLDWQQTYLAILNDLHPTNLRLSNYWKEVEPANGQYDFSAVDWQIEQAQKKGIKVLLTVGRRQPRWPECHDPAWVKSYPTSEANAKVLELLKTEVQHFAKYDNIVAWQVENEPLLAVFGQCPTPDKNFLQQEYDLVASLDQRPVFLTDSGELSGWFRVASISNYIGSTMYRVVWNKWTGFWRYSWPPAWYRLHAFLVKNIYGQKKIIVTELQAEPWTWKDMKEMTIAEQNESMTLKDLKDTLEFARQTGFSEYYIWGAEWMYWRKTQGDASFWL